MMNRRRFLVTAGTVLAAITAGCARILPRASSPAPAAVPPAGGPTPTAPAFRVALLSDVHLQPESGTNNTKLAHAVADFQSMQPALWATCGDIADHGNPAEHQAFRQILSKVAKPEQWLVTTGNHEFYDMDVKDDVSVGRFCQAFGLPKPYSSRVAGGVHFIMLADEQWQSAPDHKDWAWLTPEQIRWFEQVLTANRDLFTVVFLHQPLNDTVTGSTGANAFGSTNMSKEIYALLEKNPQVKLWFSGHTHRRVDAAGQVVKKGSTTFVGLGSTAYVLGAPAGQATGGGYGRDANAMQSRMLEIYPDKVVVRARDHVAAAWLDDQELTIARA